MTTLAELDKAMKELENMKLELSKRIGGAEWLISFYDTYSVPRFGVWKYRDNHGDLAGVAATLTTDSIIEPGAYTEEELQPVLDKIMELANE